MPRKKEEQFVGMDGKAFKKALDNIVAEKDIDPYKHLTLIIRIDESPQSTNGKYDLKESIIEEFLYGITNFDYGCTFPPILFGGLKVDLDYVNSKETALVQASDFFVGYVNATHLWKTERENLDFVDVQLFF